MNAISNTVFTLLYFYYNNGPNQAAVTAGTTFPFSAALGCTGVYVRSCVRLFVPVRAHRVGTLSVPTENQVQHSFWS